MFTKTLRLLLSKNVSIITIEKHLHLLILNFFSNIGLPEISMKSKIEILQHYKSFKAYKKTANFINTARNI